MEKKIVKKYPKDDFFVVWKPDVCIHSENCFRGLPGVFNPHQKPWINVDAASGKTIVDQIAKCPSGALSILREGIEEGTTETSIELMKDGPLLISGKIFLKGSDGVVKELEGKATAFCRCGGSKNKPFCDGSHKKVGFKA